MHDMSPLQSAYILKHLLAVLVQGKLSFYKTAMRARGVRVKYIYVDIFHTWQLYFSVKQLFQWISAV